MHKSITINLNIFKVTMTMWGEKAKNFTAEEKDIIVIENATVSNYQGFSLNANRATILKV